MSDAVNKPAHYNQGPIECIDAMRIVLTPEEYRGFLKGNAIKYLWREENKGGIEDLRKAKWYLDRLIEHCDESLLDISKGLVKAWTCEDGKAKQVYPEQPKPTLNSDKIPEGYRKLKDSSIEPRQRGDLRWSVAEKRYIEIGFDEIGYANRENWAACRKITGEVTGEVTREVTGEVKPPDGWRWLRMGEVIRKGDKPKNGDSVPLLWIGRPCGNNQFILRRNKFEVGEKVVRVLDEFEFVIIDKHSRCNDVYVARNKMTGKIHKILDRFLAPYIEETKPTVEVKPPDGWRWLEVGEVICRGDKFRDLKSETWIECVGAVGDSLQDFHKPTIRRNKFEVGEKVVAKDSHEIWEVDSLVNGVYQLRKDQTFFGSYPEHLAPYIEETK